MLILTHKGLTVYKVALELLKEVYRLTKNFPKDEQYGLVSQLRRASISVCSNIAEGAARKLKKDRKRFYVMARSSIVEIDTQFEIAFHLEYLTQNETEKLERDVESVFKMLSKMISNLEE